MKEKKDLNKAAEIAIYEVLKVQKSERVLIATNPAAGSKAIAEALFEAAAQAGARPVLMMQQEKSLLDYSEEAVLAAIGTVPDVFISMTSNKLGKDARALEKPYVDENGVAWDHVFHYHLHGSKKLRAFWSPQVSPEIFARTVCVNYQQMQKRAALLKDLLNQAVQAQIKAPGGTDLVLGLKGRKTFLDDGDFSDPGKGGNLPAGEVFISPENGTAHGSLVFDGSMAVKKGSVLCKTPISCLVEEGRIVSIDGGEEARLLQDVVSRAEEDAASLKDKSDVYRKNARALGELGIGLNPACGVNGVMLEDEKAFETCHIAIGSNYDEDAPALIHLDGVIRRPDIELVFPDGSSRCILKKGILQE